MESFKREISGKVRYLQVELSDAKFEIDSLKTKNGELEKRVEELENKNETQKLIIDQLEQTIDEKIIESEMRRTTPTYFCLNDDELAVLSQYG